MKLIKLIPALFLLFSTTVCLQAQDKGKITGTLRDAQTHAAVPFATVTLTKQDNKTAIATTQADSTGSFVLDVLQPGIYTLRLTSVGYDTIVKGNIVIPASGTVVNEGEVGMAASKNNALGGVTVSTAKPTLQSQDGLKIFSVDQSLVSKGGTAADVLQNVPTLQIDINGNVSFRGSTGVTILVDGKPSLIANGDVTQLLQSIPADAIDRIEIIANPSAKYDASGEHIINIVLKKNARPGLNGAITASGGTRNNYNIGANLGYQSGNINLYGNYSFRDGDTYSNGFQYITFLYPTDNNVFSNEFFPSITSNKIQNLKVGIDYSIAPKSVLSISGAFNSRNRRRDEVLDITNFDASHALIASSHQTNNINSGGNTYEFDVDYSQHFKKPREELTFNFSYATGATNNGQFYQGMVNNLTLMPYPGSLQSNVNNNSSNYIVQTDYVLPIGKTGQFSAGYKGQFNQLNQNQTAFDLVATGKTPLYTFTNVFNANSYVHALYVTFQDQLGNFNYQLGLRGEDANLKAAYMGYDTSNNFYTTPINIPVKGLYPGVVLTEKLPNNQQLQLNYNHRVSRPAPTEVNPSVDFSDPTNYSTGNPFLTPEAITSVELDYNRTWHNISFTSGLYYTGISNVIKHIQTGPVDDVITTIPGNLKYSGSTGVELISNFTFAKGWDLIANGNIFLRQNGAAPQYGITANSDVAWNANITANMAIAKGLSIQVHADYRSPVLILQDYNRNAWGLDAAAKYDFPGNQASLSFNSVDIFNSRDWAFLRTSDNLTLNFERRYLASRATLTFSWRFGKTFTQKQARKKEDNSDKRVDSAL